MKKKLSIVSLLLVFTMILSSCQMLGLGSSEKKDYTYENMTITLPGNFNEENLEGFHAVYSSRQAAIYVLKEDFETYPDLVDYSLDEYFDLIVEVNQREDAKKDTINAIPTFEYDAFNEETKENYSYLVTAHESDEAFWLIQYTSLKEDYDELREDFVEWNNSVVITN